MILTLAKKTLSLLLAASFVLLVCLAVYVSLGRQLMPYVNNYRADIEAELSLRLGQTVQIAVLDGHWRGFNPVLDLQKVSIAAPGTSDAPAQALQLDFMTLEVDAVGSLLTRTLQLSSIDIESPALTLVEGNDGRWQLLGFESSGEVSLSPDQVLDLVSRVRDLTLSNLELTLQRADGRGRLFERSRVRFQNRGPQHFLHLDVWQDGVIGPLSVSAELQGNQIADLSGQIYLLVPQTDYSEIVAGRINESLTLDALAGNGEVWVDVQKGQVEAVQGSVSLSELAVALPAPLRVQDLGTQFFVHRGEAGRGWELWLEKFGFAWNGQTWRESNLYASYEDTAGLDVRADLLNLTVATGMLAASELLPAEANPVLAEINPRGELANLDLEWQRAAPGSEGDQWRLVTNVVDGAISARGPTPAIWGIDAYAELLFDTGAQRLTGFADVDSHRLMFQLPHLFDDVWDYDHVNGRVAVDLDLSQGQLLKLSSSVIVAESDVATGRAQFSLLNRRSGDEGDAADLELMVGLSEGDVSHKSLYLPRAEGVKDGLRELMNWLDRAIQGGRATNSGLIYRGSVMPDADPAERTLQMYFNVADGSLQYDPQWPALDRLAGHVLIDDRNVDIRVNSGESLGMGFDATSAAIRPNDSGNGNWLTVSGKGAGEAQQALHYLRETPVTRGFGNYISDWQGEGIVDLALSLRIPLGIQGSTPQVNVDLQLQDDTLYIPEFELRFNAVNGQLRYSTQNGLIGEALSARLFEQAVDVKVSSQVDAARTTQTLVDMRGRVDVPALRAWPKQSRFVSDVLSRAQGNMDYLAQLEIVQPAESELSGSEAQPRRRLTLTSELEGISLDYPEPFRKSEDGHLPLRMTIDFLDAREDLRLSLSDLASINMGLADGQIRNGLIFLGSGEEVNVRRLNASAPGLDVLGTLPRFDYEEWMRAVRDITSSSSSAASGGAANFSSLRQVINAVDVNIADAYAFGQNARDLNVQITSEARDWKLMLASETVAGELRVPYAATMPLDVNLQYLHLPAPEGADEPVPVSFTDSGQAGPPAANDPVWLEPVERVDILADVDPRVFPYMRFKAASITRGESDYGSWSFLLEPNAGGAAFSDLLFDTRGMRAGKDGEEGRFVWTFDGERHHSYFSSVLEAGNIGAVLSNFGYAPSLESSSALFHASLDWPGSPAFFSVESLSGDMDLKVLDGRFLQSNAGAANGALKLISIINFDALVRRLRFSDDLLRRGLSYEQIYGSLKINDGIVDIIDRLQIIGPASLFQVTGQLDLAHQTIDGYLYITLPVSDNIPWMSGIAVLNNLINWQVAVGVFLFDQIFGDQVDSLTSAQYTLKGPWEGLEPSLNQVFGTPGTNAAGTRAAPAGQSPAQTPAAPPASN
ncbi:MAG: TIGR02099 family protein [Pseudomonadales bacterium]|nr:TIGR02099 family protein [Pseudomonadales bacterium]